MSKSMMGSAGGGKVTVEGLDADVVVAGNTVAVKQGSKNLENVLGTAKQYLTHGGVPHWGNGTYNLGTFPKGKYTIFYGAFGWAEASESHVTIGGVEKNRVSAGKGDGKVATYDFELSGDTTVQVINSGYSGGCIYALWKTG